MGEGWGVGTRWGVPHPSLAFVLMRAWSSVMHVYQNARGACCCCPGNRHRGTVPHNDISSHLPQQFFWGGGQAMMSCRSLLI